MAFERQQLFTRRRVENLAGAIIAAGDYPGASLVEANVGQRQQMGFDYLEARKDWDYICVDCQVEVELLAGMAQACLMEVKAGGGRYRELVAQSCARRREKKAEKDGDNEREVFQPRYAEFGMSKEKGRALR